MNSLLKCFTISLLLRLSSCQGQDLTTQIGAYGTSVVTATVSRIQQSGIFSSDNELLRRIAYVETRDGTDPETYRDDYDGGIWAVNLDLLEATQNTTQYQGLINLHLDISANFFIQWSSVQWSDLRRPLYSALAARLYMYTVPPIPMSSEIQSQAIYWRTHYNLLGNTSDFVALVNELEAQRGLLYMLSNFCGGCCGYVGTAHIYACCSLTLIKSASTHMVFLHGILYVPSHSYRPFLLTAIFKHLILV